MERLFGWSEVTNLLLRYLVSCVKCQVSGGKVTDTGAKVVLRVPGG